jgi:3-oxoacyl-[acyl-carrier protein] reductase
MDLNLTGKHALVCGASEGIGRAVAHELALLGADVTLLARRAEALQAAAAALPRTATGQRHDWIAADVAQHDALSAKVESLASAHPVHILINNTGGPPGGRAIDADAAAYLDAFHKHLLANQILVQAVLPGMQTAQWGRIVNIISTSVKEPIANLGVSNSIRGAVASWAKTLSRELAVHRITVNSVLPGYTETGRLAQIVSDRAQASGDSAAAVVEAMKRTVPLGRFAEPAEIAATVAFLCSPAAAYVNGVNFPVDGGRMHSL